MTAGRPPEALTTSLGTFVREATNLLGNDPRANPLPMLEEVFWVRQKDQYFRPDRNSKPDWELVVSSRWQCLQSLPAYADARRRLVSEKSVADQLDKPVGAFGFARQITVDHILLPLVGTAVSPQKHTFEFDADAFYGKWCKFWDALSSDHLTYVLIAPLAGFYGRCPAAIAEGLQIDKLSDDEIRQCVSAGLFSPWPSMRVREISPEATVGMRWTMSIQKLIGAKALEAKDEGTHRRIDDVLTLLRLFKGGSISSPGTVSSFHGWICEDMVYPRHRSSGRRPGPLYQLTTDEHVQLQRLWQDLTGRQLKDDRLRFSSVALRRFNFAFDRYDPEDRLIDLLIGAEALFLRDKQELALKLALRAAKFMKQSSGEYTEREVFDIMASAYKARGAIVHGDEVGKKLNSLAKKSH